MAAFKGPGWRKATRGYFIPADWTRERLQNLRYALGERMGIGRAVTQREMALFLGFGDTRAGVVRYQEMESGRRWFGKQGTRLLEWMEAGVLPPGWQRMMVAAAHVRVTSLPPLQRGRVGGKPPAINQKKGPRPA